MVKEVAAGVWSIPITVTSPGLKEVFIYGVEHDSGIVLIDAGWPAATALIELERGLTSIGAGFADICGVLVTHVHADHYGLAADIQVASGAWIAMHPNEAAFIEDRYVREDQLQDRFAVWLRSAGVESERIDEVASSTLVPVGSVVPVQPDVLLEDGDTAPVPGRQIRSLHTPGHTPGHLVFHLDDHSLFTGDHLLPRSTPNVSYGPLSDDDPLADYLESLRRISALGAETFGLPAHQYPFERASARAEELIAHHEARLVEVLEALGAGAVTVLDVCRSITWRQEIDELPGFLLRAALGETHAHLHRLAACGLATVTSGPPESWRVVR